MGRLTLFRRLQHLFLECQALLKALVLTFFNPKNNTRKRAILLLSLTPFYRDTSQSTEKLIHLPKVTQSVISRAGLESSNLGPESVLLAMTTYSHLAGP